MNQPLETQITEARAHVLHIHRGTGDGPPARHIYLSFPPFFPLRVFKGCFGGGIHIVKE